MWKHALLENICPLEQAHKLTLLKQRIVLKDKLLVSKS